jgi:hypothetical protein
MDVQCTGVAIHSLNPPGNFFHRVKIRNRQSRLDGLES